MNETETVAYVAQIMSSARRMGLAIRNTSGGGKFSFEWIDEMVGAVIAGPDRPDLKQALVAACDALVDRIQVTPNHDPIQSQYKI